MDNSEFINRLAKRMNTDHKSASAMSAMLCELITARATELDNIALPGFGTFVPVKSDERIGEDENGARCLFPPSIVLTFTPGSRLKKSVNNSAEK